MESAASQRRSLFMDEKAELESIIFVMDAQGFICNKKFYPREIAIVGPAVNICMEVDTQLSENDFSRDEYFNYTYMKNLIHGMKLRPSRAEFGFPCMKVEDIKNFIKMIHSNTSSAIKNKIAFKNHLLEDFVKDLGIAYINLDKTSCPKIEMLYELYSNNKHDMLCHAHDIPDIVNKSKNYYKCSLRICDNLYRWVQTTVKEYVNHINSVDDYVRIFGKK